ncbi:MAG TPA: RsmB/NOP family class I SAM-dependent RNA methyltransferase [Candidatus Saccharimonadales bacterium]|nr:RsmB/NOP family class I SAM-dependent RNA methyltransferase [Candidatus Saccharimonadales bacterium]
MNQRVLALAESVVQRSSRQHLADAVLREALKAARGLPPELARKAAETVFAFFRWRGWLGAEGTDLQRQLTEAVGLQERFDREPGTFPDAELTARAAPDWVHEHLTVTPAWARFLQQRPRLWLRTQPGQSAELAKRWPDLRVMAGAGLPDALEYVGTQDLFVTPEFHAGVFEIQDLASQVVCELCTARAGETWWDACAGEGGKTLGLSARMGNQGLIWASDRAQWRLQRLKRRAARAKAFNYRLAPWEGGARLPTRTKFDGVLLDAPCSGLGTWQRNPQARWTTTPQDVAELAAVQRTLLGHVVPALKPGGRLLYAVCTLTGAETVAVADAIEAGFPALRPWPMKNPLRPQEAAAPRIWLGPEDGGNGMFVAGWRLEGPEG